MISLLPLLLTILGAALVCGCIAYAVIVAASQLNQKLKAHRLRGCTAIRMRQAPLSQQMYPVGGALFGLAAGLMLSWPPSPKAILFLMWIGMAVGYAVRRVARTTRDDLKMRDAAVLFKALSVRLAAGYNLNHALRLAAALTPHLRRAVNRCLHQWHWGPEKALAGLAEDIGISEVGTLCQVLIRAEKGGVENVPEVLYQGARNLDAKLAALQERSLAKGQMRYLLYRFVPAVAIAFLIFGSLAYHLNVVLKDSLQAVK